MMSYKILMLSGMFSLMFNLQIYTYILLTESCLGKKYSFFTNAEVIGQLKTF